MKGVTTVVMYRDTAGEWRWRGLASNGEQVADSGEGYVNYGDARAMAAELFPHARVSIDGETVEDEGDAA